MAPSLRVLSKLGRSTALRRPSGGSSGGLGFVIGRSLSTSAAPKSNDMALIRELREASGAPVVDCKNALAAEGVNGDIGQAFEWLRKRGIAKASAMADRSANEGVIGLALDGPVGALVEVNSETDFVARNSKFQDFVGKALAAALRRARERDPAAAARKGGGNAVRSLNVKQLLQTQPPGSQEVLADSLAHLVGSIRENITITRAEVLSMEEGSGVVDGYVHAAIGPNMGKTAALVAIKLATTDSASKAAEEAVGVLRSSGKSLAMHIVAARPSFLDEASVPEGALEKEKNLLLEQAKESGKDPKFLGKMVEGRLRKYLEENALVRQAHVVAEGNPKIADMLTALGEKLGGEVTVEGFARLSVGERVTSTD